MYHLLVFEQHWCSLCSCALIFIGIYFYLFESLKKSGSVMGPAIGGLLGASGMNLHLLLIPIIIKYMINWVCTFSLLFIRSIKFIYYDCIYTYVSLLCINTFISLVFYIFMYACMHVCMHVCMYVGINAYMYVYMYVCIYACMYVWMCVCIYVCIYVCMYHLGLLFMYVYMYVCICLDACTYIFTYIYVCMHVCMYIYVRKYVCNYTCTVCT